MPGLDHSTARFLTWRYAVALVAVAALTVAAQALVQLSLSRQANDARVINLAGRQRMLSQRLCKAALARARAADPAEAARRGEELRRVREEWSAAHARLTAGTDLHGAGLANSAAVADAFGRIAASFAAMLETSASATIGEPGLDLLLREERTFLAGMEAVVALYTAEASARVERLRALELWLCIVALAVLALEAAFIFRPAVRRIRQAIADRERLAEQELVTRELAVASQVARDIGQDLHDGLGQTLTAMSFLARRLEQDLGEAPAREQAALLARTASDAIAQARALARRLAPVDIQAVGLEAALRELAAQTQLAAGVPCTLRWGAGIALPARAADDCYRLVQEAVTNALRHARPSAIAIAIGRDDAGIALRIDNDGVASGASAGAEGVGQRSMRARAARLGGRLESGPDGAGGWTVHCRFPNPMEEP